MGLEHLGGDARPRPTPRCWRSPPSASSALGARDVGPGPRPRRRLHRPRRGLRASTPSARDAARARRRQGRRGRAGRAPGSEPRRLGRRPQALVRLTELAGGASTSSSRPPRAFAFSPGRERGGRGAEPAWSTTLRRRRPRRPPGHRPRRGARPRLLHRPRLPRLRARPRLRGRRRRPLRRAPRALRPPDARGRLHARPRPRSPSCSSGKAPCPVAAAAPAEPVIGRRPRRARSRRRARGAPRARACASGTGAADEPHRRPLEGQAALGHGGALPPGGACHSRRARGAGSWCRCDGLRFLFVKDMDVPTYVEYGVADCGIAGRDVLLEAGSDVLRAARPRLRPLPARGGAARRARASPTDRASTVRVATKYPRVATGHFLDRGVSVEVVKLAGSVEIAPGLGLADCIVDVVETGRTLVENGLEPVEDGGRVVGPPHREPRQLSTRAARTCRGSSRRCARASR